MGIKAGDNGTQYEFLVRENGNTVPLTGATVTIVLNGATRIVKTATISDTNGGVCSITLTRTDIAVAGEYQVQGIVKFPSDGDKDFASDVIKLTISARI